MPWATHDDGLSSVYFVKLALRNSDGELLSENVYWRASGGNNFQALNSLPGAELDAEAVYEADGKENRITASLANPSSNVAFSVRLKLLRAESSKRVLPAFYDDNYFTIFPGEARDIAVRFDAKYLDGEDPKLMVEGYNMSENEVPITTVNIAGQGGAVRASAPAFTEMRIYDMLGRVVGHVGGADIGDHGLAPVDARKIASHLLRRYGVYVVVYGGGQGTEKAVRKRLLIR